MPSGTTKNSLNENFISENPKSSSENFFVKNFSGEERTDDLELINDFPPATQELPLKFPDDLWILETAKKSEFREQVSFQKKNNEYSQEISTKKIADDFSKISTLENEALSKIAGTSETIVSLKKQVLEISKFDVPVIIMGESGTGKNLVAETIHKLSQRKNHPFVTINTAQKNSELLKTDLFGSKKGAFTDALERKGKILEANGGTLFLDEIGDIPLDTQKELLGFLQTKQFSPLGSDKEIGSNVRLIFATNANLKKKLVEEEIRGDFLSRINVFPIKIPPLRKHLEDLTALTEFFIPKIARENNIPKKELTSAAMAMLQSYDFPGNIRDLQTILTRALILSQDSPKIDAKHIYLKIF